MSHSRPCSSAEVSGSSDVNKMYDVFLSFRGTDTREGIVRRLYSALVEQGILTFIDEESLEKGDHIPSSLERGITESRICIPVFSKNFAQSKWCLKEVYLMVKSGVKICPLFYDVLPSVLRCWDGSEYAEYFKQHESQQRLSAELILEYKTALEGVSNLCGWCFNQYNGRDDDLIQDVVLDVRKSLHSSHPHKVYLDIPECFGLDGSVKHLKRLISAAVHQKKIVKVGIHGMGGIGKTTLAKIVCKELPFSQFQAFSFVPSVGERCTGANGLVKLQTHMLKGISRFGGEVDHVDQGKGLLHDSLRGKKVLLLLDDIESPEQLEALLGNYRDLGAGSCVIITSRDEQILRVANVNIVYELRRLPHQHAVRLFNFHAFSHSCCPDQELQTLSNDIVSACEGLPLALQTFGKQLVGEGDRDVWKEMVGKLRCEPNIQKKFRVSYDRLDPIEKEMFQDIACFLRWRKKEIVLIFWAGLIPSPHASLRSLMQKSLVSLGSTNEFLMHRCLQDLGRSISNEVHTEPRKRIRLFDEDDAHRVLRRPREKAKLVRYFWYEPKEPMTLKAEMFKSLYNLQLLWLTGIAIEGHFSGEFSLEDLRWLSLRKYSSRRLPQGMNLHKLVILEVTDSQITHLCDETTEENLTMRPTNLKVLILRGCASLENLPATLCYTPLQMLDLHNCHSLSSLPNNVGSWTSLVTLDMGGCSVSSLPQDFGELANLTELNLSRCKNLSKLPASFGNLIQLERLEIHHNHKLTELPDSFGGLKALTHLYASYCHSLSSLPNTVGSLISLVYLEMEGCGVSSLPQDFCNLANLQELNLSYCPHLSKLPANFGNLTQLERLEIPHNPGLTELPDSFGGLKALAYLDAGHCRLTDNGLPPTISELCSLKILHLEGNRIRRLPDGLEKSRQLEELHLDGCKELAGLTELPSSLRLLYARNCFGLDTICCLPGLPSLMVLDVSKSCHLTRLHGLESLKKLTRLNLVGCTGISCGALESCLVGLTALDCVFVGGPGVSLAQLQIFYDSFKDFSFSKNCLLDNPDAIANWLQGEAGGKDGYSIDYCTDEKKIEYCAGYIVCLVSGKVQIREDCEVDPGINRLSYTVQRDDNLLVCPVNHQNSTIDSGDYLEVRLVRADTTPDFAWLKSGNKVRVNARSDYENWQASFKFLMYEETMLSQEHKPPKMITFVM